MRRDDAVAILRQHESEVRELGAVALYLFGSTARDEAGPASDVDIFIDPDYERLSFVELLKLEDRLSAVLSKPVELTTRDGLHPRIRADIEREAVKVFG